MFPWEGTPGLSLDLGHIAISAGPYVWCLSPCQRGEPMLIIEFEESKPYFDLWLSGVGCPVHGFKQKNPHFVKT